MSRTSPLDRLSEMLGIVERYDDYDRQPRIAGPETKSALLKAIGYEVSCEADAVLHIEALEAAERERIVPAETVAPAHAPIAIRFSRPADWHLLLQDGLEEFRAGHAEHSLELQPLPIGIHQLRAISGATETTSLLIVTPRRAPSLLDVTDGQKVWGVSGALYGLRSSKDLGIGTYMDLAAAGVAFAEQGADFIGINPIHALGSGTPIHYSPYSPTHRGFYNPRHIDLHTNGGSARDDVLEPVLRARAAQVNALRSEELVDHAATADLHDTVLRTYHEEFPSIGRDADSYQSFLAAHDTDLRRFAIFETLAEELGPDWRTWPAEYQSPLSSAVARLAAQRAHEVDFHSWKQWLADRQLARAQAMVRAAGMRLGLYLDMAVGTRLDGAECWSSPDAFATGVSLGTPPDAFSSSGQTWNLAPFNPVGLSRAGYAPFIRALRATMRHAGLVRIDHFIGLERSFWVPETGEPGGYVRYPRDIMLAIVAAEAHRSGTVIIGEDLGLIPEDFRSTVEEAGFYGCAVMQFERDTGKRPLPTTTYRPRTLASAGTHDTPTVRGFIEGHDIEWSVRLGRQNEVDAKKAREQRQEDVTALAAACRDSLPTGEAKTISGSGAQPSPELVHAALANAASEMVVVQADDLFGSSEQQNVPGTTTEYPNWRRRLPVPVERFAEDSRLAGVGKLMAATGRARDGRD